MKTTTFLLRTTSLALLLGGSVWGSSPGNELRLLARIDGASGEELFGSALAVPGDLDGDGYADLVIGAPAAPGGDRAGRAHVWSPRTDRPLTTLAGTTPGFGSSLASLADLDGDGIGDFLVGEAPYSGRTGTRLEGSTARGAQRSAGLVVEHRPDAPTGIRLRGSVRADWNGDGTPDRLEVVSRGAPDRAPDGAPDGAPGGARVAITLVSGVDGAPLATLEDLPLAPGRPLALVAMGDLDGDERPELVVGSSRSIRVGDGVERRGSVGVYALRP